MEPGAEWLLVPGLAFDSQGTRLGHGGGFIDRLLASEPEALSIGCGWECQWCDHPLPQEDHDRPIAHVVTEAGIHSI